MTAVREVYEGMRESWVLFGAIVLVLFGGFFRAMGRLASAFIREEPLPVGPDKTLKLS